MSQRLALSALLATSCVAACSVEDDLEDTSGGLTRCLVTVARATLSDGMPSQHVFSFDAAARLLVNDAYTYGLDEADRPARVSGNEAGGPVWYWTTAYDARGNVASVEHYTAGVTTYANTYEGDRLTGVDFSGGGGPGAHIAYRYEDPSAPGIWTRQEIDSGADGSVDAVSTRTLAGGRITSISYGDSDGAIAKVWTYVYEGDQVTSVERDGGYWASDVPDGTVNIRYRWVRDAQGALTAFEQDGTDESDDPFVDGKPDYRETFSPGCAALLQQFPWLGHLPGPDSVGPRWRTERN